VGAANSSRPLLFLNLWCARSFDSAPSCRAALPRNRRRTPTLPCLQRFMCNLTLPWREAQTCAAPGKTRLRQCQIKINPILLLLDDSCKSIVSHLLKCHRPVPHRAGTVASRKAARDPTAPIRFNLPAGRGPVKPAPGGSAARENVVRDVLALFIGRRAGQGLLEIVHRPGVVALLLGQDAQVDQVVRGQGVIPQLLGQAE